MIFFYAKSTEEAYWNPRPRNEGIGPSSAVDFIVIRPALHFSCTNCSVRSLPQSQYEKRDLALLLGAVGPVKPRVGPLLFPCTRG